MVITFLVMLWIGLRYLSHAYILAQSSRARARGCAFHVATNDCSSIPDFCQVSVEEAESEQPQGLDALSETLEGGGADDNDDNKYQAATQEELSSEIRNGLFQRAETTTEAELERPRLLGGGTADLGQAFSLPCNPKPGTLMDKVLDLFQQLLVSAKPSEE